MGGGTPPNYVVAVVTYNRVEWCHKKTLTMLKENKIPSNRIYLIVHTEEQKKMYEVIPKDLYKEILVTNKQGRWIGQVNWVMDYFDKGQRILRLDDDITGIYKLQGEKIVKTKTLASIMDKGFSLCQENGFKLWGLYPSPNAYYMKQKPPYTMDLRFIVGPLMGIINEKIHMDTKLNIKGDYDYTLQSYIKNGGVIRFNNIAFKYDIAKKDPQRLEKYNKDNQYLIKKYPDYVRLNPTREGEVLLNKGIKGGKITEPIENRYEATEEVKEDKIVLSPKVKSLQERLLEELEKTKIPRIPNSNYASRGKTIGSKGFTMNFGAGRKKFAPSGEYIGNKEHPALFKLMVEYGNEILPKDFDYTIITLNYNLKAKKHKDGGNAGVSCITFLGDYVGGGLYVYDTKDKPTLYDTHNKVIVMNGATLAHRTEAFKGERYALIYYSQKNAVKTAGMKMIGKGLDEEEEAIIY
jgi:hypothetical protein